jgi:hypothetical protein
MPEYESGFAGQVLPDGVYEFGVVDADEKTSERTNNVMIELQLDCWDAKDPTIKVRVVDRLVFVPNSYWRIDAFRKATGEKITTGQKVSFEAEDCIDRTGKVQLKTSEYQARHRNEVDFYIEPEPNAQPAASQSMSPSSAAKAQPVAAGAVPKSNRPF